MKKELDFKISASGEWVEALPSKYGPQYQVMKNFKYSYLGSSTLYRICSQERPNAKWNKAPDVVSAINRCNRHYNAWVKSLIKYSRYSIVDVGPLIGE